MFRMVQGPHSSGKFIEGTVEIGTLAVKYENWNGCFSTCVTFSLLETIQRVVRYQKYNIRGIMCHYFELRYSKIPN